MFPIKNFKYHIPNETEPGGFGFVRKHDIHTGIDLYCSKGEPIYSISNGIILDIIKFTGFEESPWWNDTWAVIAYHPGIGTIVYGEVYVDDSYPMVGDIIRQGDIVGNVATVLKEDKGKNPPNMLHIELYKGVHLYPVIWELNTEKPNKLENPKQLLEKLLSL